VQRRWGLRLGAVLMIRRHYQGCCSSVPGQHQRPTPQTAAAAPAAAAAAAPSPAATGTHNQAPVPHARPHPPSPRPLMLDACVQVEAGVREALACAGVQLRVLWGGSTLFHTDDLPFA